MYARAPCKSEKSRENNDDCYSLTHAPGMHQFSPPSMRNLGQRTTGCALEQIVQIMFKEASEESFRLAIAPRHIKKSTLHSRNAPASNIHIQIIFSRGIGES